MNHDGQNVEKTKFGPADAALWRPADSTLDVNRFSAERRSIRALCP